MPAWPHLRADPCFQPMRKRLQSPAQALPPGFQPSRHRVRRTRAQMGTDAFHGGTLALRHQRVCGLVDVYFGNALGHCHRRRRVAGRGRYGCALPWPVPEPVVIQFLVDHLTRRTARARSATAAGVFGRMSVDMGGAAGQPRSTLSRFWPSTSLRYPWVSKARRMCRLRGLV